MRLEVASVREIPEMHSMGHTCANLNGDLLFVWGGTKDGAAYVATKNSSIWIYETLTGYWRHRVCSGECPPYLSSCTSCLIGQKMFIFGGHSTLQDNWMNGLYCLDLETFIWSDLGSQAQARPTKPIRSDKNVSWSFGGKFYVFGGYGWSQVEHYSALLDCQKDLQLTPDYRWPKFGWNNQLVEYSPSEKTWLWPHYSGKCPSARAAHSGALMGELYYVFGGRDSHERLNDLYTLNMKTLNWQLVVTVSSDPSSQLYRSIGPIRHLLETQDESEPDLGERLRARGLNAEAVAQHEDDLVLDENHRQIVEEMHGVGLEEEDDEYARWEPAMASSSSASAPAPLSSSDQPVLSGQSSGESGNDGERLDGQVALIGSKPSDGITVDDDDDDDFEYPHPSHLLERWSLSSNNDNNGLNTSDCSQDYHREQQAALNPITQPTQSIFLINNLRPDPHTRGLDSASTASAMAHQHPQRQLEEHGNNNNHRRDINQQQQQQQQQRQQSHESRSLNNPVMPIQSAPDEDDQDHAIAAAEAPFVDNGADTAGTSASRLPIAQLPTGRSFCSLTPISDDDMLLFGGVNSQDQNLDDCWVFNVKSNRWTRIDYKHKLLRPRLWHTGSRTKQNEVVILGGSYSEKIDEYCSDVLVISFEPKSLKRLALDGVSRSVRMKAIQRTRGLPSTLLKLIKLRKQAIALTTCHRPVTSQPTR